MEKCNGLELYYSTHMGTWIIEDDTLNNIDTLKFNFGNDKCYIYKLQRIEDWTPLDKPV